MLTFSPSPTDILIAILLALGLLSMTFSRLEPGTRAADGWGVGILLLGFGLAMLQIDGRAPTLLSVTGEILMLSSIPTVHRAIRRLRPDPRPEWKSPLWACVAAASLLLLWFTFVEPSARARVVVFSGTLALMTGWAAAMSVNMPTQINRASRKLFIGLIWCVSILFVARMAGTLAAPAHADEHFQYDTLAPVAALIGVVLFVALTVAMMWMEVSLLNAKLAGLISQDALTGLLNHRAIMESCEREVSRAELHRQPLSAALLDIDHFNSVNDAHGHSVGDAVLRHLSTLLVGESRKHDFCSRFGGEEFLILMPVTGTADAANSMERLRQRIESRPYRDGKLTIPLTVSIGVAELVNHITGVDALIGAAERALYRAKRGGRNRVETASAEAPDFRQ